MLDEIALDLNEKQKVSEGRSIYDMEIRLLLSYSNYNQDKATVW